MKSLFYIEEKTHDIKKIPAEAVKGRFFSCQVFCLRVGFNELAMTEVNLHDCGYLGKTQARDIWQNPKQSLPLCTWHKKHHFLLCSASYWGSVSIQCFNLSPQKKKKKIWALSLYLRARMKQKGIMALNSLRIFVSHLKYQDMKTRTLILSSQRQ